MSPHADIGVNPRKTEYLEVIDNSVSLGNLAVSCERRGVVCAEGLFGIS